MQPRIERVAATATRKPGVIECREPRSAPVRQHDIERLDVIDRHAVPRGPRATRVVADHAAEGRTVGGGGVGGEEESVRSDGAIEVVLNHPGLHARRARVG
jgi:hypothetical protein